MKITKSQLTLLIKEELETVLEAHSKIPVHMVMKVITPAPKKKVKIWW